jgi:hypothetical protein
LQPARTSERASDPAMSDVAKKGFMKFLLKNHGHYGRANAPSLTGCDGATEMLSAA